MEKIRRALVSVYDKTGLDELINVMRKHYIEIVSTGGTKTYIEGLGHPVQAVEALTGYPSIFGGRVKTLHPVIFGGILHRRENESDLVEATQYNIPPIDLVIVDLYPFEATVASGGSPGEIIEKIDIGGISLIRAAAKNFRDVLIVPSRVYYHELVSLLDANNGLVSEADRRRFAMRAFDVSAHYDTAINAWFASDPDRESFRADASPGTSLRYGENPHQAGRFYGDLSAMFRQLHGKAISYNNLLDIEAAIQLISEFTEPTLAILKHNNACGISTRNSLSEAWEAALAGDPVSAFGGIIIANGEIDETVASAIDKIFYEVLIAPSFTDEALKLLRAKKNRILLELGEVALSKQQFRSMLNGILVQDRDTTTERPEDLKPVTEVRPDAKQVEDLLFANILVKHTKSNAMVLVRNKQLLASGTGQTSRVDALQQAIAKAKHFGHDLKGAVMASDAFFPFPDNVQIAHEAGITAVIQPGGSVKDKESVDYCNKNGLAMVFTGTRHFKH